ncbi:fluoride efflux transporter FluC [Oceanobacillus damuensis]|uniref:fluoride efflux transporter FluC n=1 Tax=Oceanobacillus damuensis TaxID=937928 RepID=UPI00082A07D1|nr:CrcB family protein [Oceanobacillus damuensis]
MNLLLVAIGGFLGSIARYSISVKLNKRLIATWIANISGSMLLAFSLHFYMQGLISDRTWLLLGVGFCGAYTTFSTFGNEVLQLLLHQQYIHAGIYVLSSFTVSILAVFITLSLL